MNVYPYRPDDAEAWDQFVFESVNGTFLHTRRFLNYHKNRFEDASLLIRDDRGKLIGLLPAACDPHDQRVVGSHPGLTYGGMVRTPHLNGSRMITAIEQCAEYYRAQGFQKFRYKAIPFIYQRVPSDDDLYAMFRLGAKIWRTDLCAVIDHNARGPLSRNRKTGIKRAQQTVNITTESSRLPGFWPILETQLQERHGVRPTHTLEEITTLIAWFPNNIRCVAALDEGRVIAGVVLFLTQSVTRAQYSAANLRARETSALDGVFEYCINASAIRSRYFDFGNSNERDGRILNEGLYRYKTGLGAGGTVQQFYEVAL